MRPEIDEEVAAAVDELVDEHTRVPVEHLTFNQRVEVLVEITRDLSQPANTNQNQTISFSGQNTTGVNR
jgi:hypothetical protein